MREAAAAGRSVQRRGGGGGKGTISGTLDELSFSHIFDYNAIEQIANGLERMVQSWSGRQEDRARTSVSLDEQRTQQAAAAAAAAGPANDGAASSEMNALQNLASIASKSTRTTTSLTEVKEHLRPDETWLHKEYVNVGTYSVDKSPLAKASDVSSLSLENGDKVTSSTRSSSPMKSTPVKDGSAEKNHSVEGTGNGSCDGAKISPTLRSSSMISSPDRSLRHSPAVDDILLDSSNEVEMQKVYVDVASSIERSFLSSSSIEALSPSTRRTRPPGETETRRAEKDVAEGQATLEKEAMRNLCALSDVEEFGDSFLQHNDDLLAAADEHKLDDTFVTSPTYWRVEPEGLTTGTTPKESSFVHDASYEKADFSTSYEERPSKRKKETNRRSKLETGFESLPEGELGHGAYDLETLNADRCFGELQRTPLKSYASNLSLVEGEDSKELYKSKVEELQIGLLECAAEYEVKMVEMEMKMLHLKSKTQQQEPPCPAKPEKERMSRRLDNYRKHNLKLQREKEALSKEIMELKKKERQVDLLRKNLDDALQKVNTFQREMVKKEEELVDSQLKEKEAKAHLYQVEAALQQAEASRIDHGSVLSLLNSISQWLQTIKKASFVKFDPRQQLQVQQYEDSLSKLMEEYLPQRSLPKISSMGLLGYLEDNSPHIEKSQDIKDDVKALQDELEKLACRRSTF